MLSFTCNRPGSDFGRFTQICREAHRSGKPELLLRALERLVPIRPASGEDMRVLLRSRDGLMSALTLAGQDIVKLARQRVGVLVELMREPLKRRRSGGAVPAAIWAKIRKHSCLRNSGATRTTDSIPSNLVELHFGASHRCSPGENGASSWTQAR
jgi:hypothetical protein